MCWPCATYDVLEVEWLRERNLRVHHSGSEGRHYPSGCHDAPLRLTGVNRRARDKELVVRRPVDLTLDANRRCPGERSRAQPRPTPLNGLPVEQKLCAGRHVKVLALQPAAMV